MCGRNRPANRVILIVLTIVSIAASGGRSTAGENARRYGNTVASDMTHSNWSPECPSPPFRCRWMWVNGERVDPAKVAGLKAKVVFDTS